MAGRQAGCVGRKGVFIATQLNSTRQREQQLTQFVGRYVINKNTTDLAVRCSTGSVELSSVELCRYKHPFTVTCTTATSYLDSSSREAVAAAEMAASRKTAKQQQPGAQPTFFPIAVESHGPLCEDAHGSLRDLRRRLSEFSGDVREVQFLYQRISVVVQRFNAMLLPDSFFS